MPKKFRPQRNNANAHTDRGLELLDTSIARNGWIGAITTAADGEVFDGSARLETISRNGEIDPIVIEADGTRPIIVVRTDIPNADDPKAIELSVAANRIAQVDLNWQGDVLKGWNEDPDNNIDHYFSEAELDRLSIEWENGLNDEPDFIEGDPIEPERGADDRYPLAITLTWAELQEWKVIKESIGVSKDREAFIKLMRGDA